MPLEIPLTVNPNKVGRIITKIFLILAHSLLPIGIIFSTYKYIITHNDKFLGFIGILIGILLVDIYYYLKSKRKK